MWSCEQPTWGKRPACSSSTPASRRSTACSSPKMVASRSAAATARRRSPAPGTGTAAGVGRFRGARPHCGSGVSICRHCHGQARMHMQTIATPAACSHALLDLLPPPPDVARQVGQSTSLTNFVRTAQESRVSAPGLVQMPRSRRCAAAAAMACSSALAAPSSADSAASLKPPAAAAVQAVSTPCRRCEHDGRADVLVASGLSERKVQAGTCMGRGQLGCQHVICCMPGRRTPAWFGPLESQEKGQ